LKLHPDDPRLTAYLLGELTADEAAEVARAAAADPAVGMALRELQGIQSLLTDTLAPAGSALLPHQRSAVVRAARQQDQAGEIVPMASRGRTWKTYAIPAAAAALVVLGTLVLVNLPGGPGPDHAGNSKDPSGWDREVPLEIALLPAPGPPDARSSQVTGTASSRLADQAAARDAALATTGDEFLRKVAERLKQTPVPPAGALPGLTPRGAVSAAGQPLLPLPVHAGRGSLSWITHSVRTERKAPPVNAVRLEEVLNSFQLRPTGSAAVAGGASIATETLACPWRPSAVLVLIAIRGATDGAREVAASFRADPATVGRYRLLGFAPVTGLPQGKLPARLPAHTTTTLAIEIDPATPADALGTIEWTVNAKPAAAIPVTRAAAVEPSDDARFGALLCAYAQWLARDSSQLIDASLVAGLAREISSPVLSPDRRDFITLVDESLPLLP
jgi:hypothetical protein